MAPGQASADDALDSEPLAVGENEVSPGAVLGGTGWRGTIPLFVPETHHFDRPAGPHRIAGVVCIGRRPIEPEEAKPSLGKITVARTARATAQSEASKTASGRI